MIIGKNSLRKIKFKEINSKSWNVGEEFAGGIELENNQIESSNSWFKKVDNLRHVCQSVAL